MAKKSETEVISETVLNQKRRLNIRGTIFALSLIFLAVCVIAIGYYAQQVKNLTRSKEAELTSIVTDTIRSITDWRSERLGDANTILDNSFIAQAVKLLIENPDDARLRQQNLEWLNAYQINYGYYTYMLFDTQGRVILRDPKYFETISEETKNLVLKARQEDSIIFSDLYRDASSSKIHQDILIPIHNQEFSSNPIAICLLRIDPDQYLYPLVQTWPVPSQSGEIILFRRDGDNVVYLNPLRFKKDAAFRLQYPINTPDLPAAKVVRGVTSVHEGIDYRGINVLFSGRQVPGTNWFLLAKIDSSETYAEIRREGWILGGILFSVLITILSFAYFLIRRQYRLYNNELLYLEKNREEIQQRYSLLRDAGNDIIIVFDESGTIIDFNDRALEAYGYSREELLGMPVMNLRAPDFHELPSKFIKKINTKGSLRFELMHQRKNGNYFPVEASIRHFIVNDKSSYLDIIRDISEQKATLSALEISEARYRGMIEHATDGIFTADLEGNYVAVNDAGCLMTGYSREEILQMNVRDLLVEKELEINPNRFGEITANKTPFLVNERSLKCKDGSLLIVEISGYRLPEGKVQGVVRDVSERVRHNQELEAALGRYQQLFEVNPLPVCVYDTTSERFLAVNQAAVDFFGYSRAEFSKMVIQDIRFPLQTMEAKKESFQRDSVNYNAVFWQYKKKDGSIVDVEITSHYLDFDGHAAQMELVVDITEKVKAEKAIKENLSYLKSIIDTSPMAMVTATPKGIVTLWNKAAEDIFGWSSEEAIDKPIPMYLESGDDTLKLSLKKILGSSSPLSFEGIRKRKDGRLINVQISTSAIRDYRDEVKGVLGIYSDITEFKKSEAAKQSLEEERNRLLQRLQLQFNSIPVGFLLTDEKLNVLDWNPEAERIFGFSRDEMIGKSEYGKIIPADQTDIVRKIVDYSISHNETAVGVNKNITKDGRQIMVEWHNTPLRDENGELIAMMDMAIDVTEKLEAENMLRTSEEKLRAFFDSDLMGIIYSDVYGNIYSANDEFLRIIGYSQQELEDGSIHWNLITPPESLGLDEKAIAQAKAEGLCTPYEKQYIRKDGKRVWVLVGFKLLGEKRENSIAFILDIDERKKVERALAESEIRYSALFKNMINGVAYCKMLYDEKGRPIDYINLKVNDIFEKLTGLKNIEGKKIREVIPGIKKDNPELFEIYDRVASSGKPESFETFVPALGIYYLIHVYSSEKGYFTTVFEDVTLNKQAEQEIKKKQELLNLTGRIAKVGGWEFDPETGKGTWTDEVALIHDLDPAEPTNVELGTSFFHRENKRKIEQAIREAIEFGKPYDLELEMVSAKGVAKVVRTIGQPEMDDKQKVIKVRGIFQDITELKKAEAEIKKLNENLEQRVRDRTAELQSVNQELEAFTYSVSHDLRAPIRAIDGFSQIIVDEHKDSIDSEILRYLQIIRKNTHNMGRLVDDLLAFSRLGKQSVKKAKIDITRLVKEVVTDIKLLNPDRKINFQIAKMPACYADAGLLRQVFVNLISNAVKFTGLSEKAVIQVGTCKAGSPLADGTHGPELACYFVKDNGVGFDMSYYQKLFRVFQRLHNIEDYEGTGVGLAIVQRIIEKHGGKVWAESEVSKGATFYFTLGEEINDDQSN